MFNSALNTFRERYVLFEGAEEHASLVFSNLFTLKMMM